MWYRRIFFFNDTATTEIYTLSLHDALPISEVRTELFRKMEPRAGAITYQNLRSGVAWADGRRNAMRGPTGSSVPEGGAWTSGVVAMARATKIFPAFQNPTATGGGTS